MLLFSFAGLLSFRIDDDKLLELLFQLPPRIPREDEPTIPIPLSTVSGSTPLDADPHFVRASHAQSRHAHCLSNWSRIAGAVSSPTAFCEIGPETGEQWPLALERGHPNTPQIPQSPRHSEWELAGTCQVSNGQAAFVDLHIEKVATNRPDVSHAGHLGRQPEDFRKKRLLQTDAYDVASPLASLIEECFCQFLLTIHFQTPHHCD